MRLLRLPTILVQVFCFFGIYMLADYFGIVRYIMEGQSYPTQASDYALLQLVSLFEAVHSDKLYRFTSFIWAVLAWAGAAIILAVVASKPNKKRG